MKMLSLGTGFNGLPSSMLTTSGAEARALSDGWSCPVLLRSLLYLA